MAPVKKHHVKITHSIFSKEKKSIFTLCNFNTLTKAECRKLYQTSRSTV
jgi:hypothetical protein